MSPDEQVVVDTIARARRRAMASAIAEAVGWGSAVAILSIVAAAVVAAAVLVWRLRRARRDAIVRALERAHPGAPNVVVTADELLRGSLDASPAARARVFAGAAAVLRGVQLRAVVPRAPLVRAVAAATAAWVLVWAADRQRPLERMAGALGGERRTTASGLSPGAMRVTITAQPPAYTGLKATTTVDPPQLAAVQGTRVTIVVETGAAALKVEHDGASRAPTRDASGQFVDHLELTKNGYYAVETEGSRRVIPVVVSPDALPAVRVTAPGRDLLLADGSQRVSFEVQASDDFGLGALSLLYTKVSGSGEQFEFQEGEIPLTVVKSTDRDWRASGAASIAALDLHDGDTLVYRAVASDRRPGDGSASSDAFFIELSALAVAAGDAFTIPEEETRYALSQQMLIVKTERLDRARASMPASAVQDASLNLAVEQRMIRAELVFMLGGEIEDEEVEAQQSTELQEGRLQNRGQRDLRAATVAMSQAEKLLTGGTTREALTAERAAVTALERAFSRDRYILRALAGRTELDPARRLTGNLSQAAGWRRDRAPAPPNRRAALLQDLLRGIGALQSGADASALAREAVRIDADSDELRRAAADLQRLADAWPSTAPDARRGQIDRLSSALAAETARSLASAPLAAPFNSAALAGAFADAVRGGTR